MQTTRWLSLAIGVALSTMAFAAPRRRVANDPAEVHRAAARALLAAGDLDGAWLELRAAVQQSCTTRVATEVVTVEAKPVARLGDALLPVPTLLTLARSAPRPVEAFPRNDLVPEYAIFRALAEADDALVPLETVFTSSPRLR